MRSLAHCRVLDLGIITAGAATSAILADLGADVIKIESSEHKDPFRKWDGEALDGSHPDLPPFFRMTNRGKSNLGLDLKSQAGRDVFLRLVANSDIVVENFSRGVLERLGLDYARLKAANPEIILASISSQGEWGPDTAYVSFGSTLEAMAGLATMTGYADGPPVISGKDLNYPDQVVAIFAAGMIATAWYARERGAGGVHLDLAQRELTTFLCGEAVLGDGPERQGNSRMGYAIQDCFRSRDDRWLAISVPQDQGAVVASLVGGAGRAALASWVGARDGAAALSALRRHGVASAAAATGEEVLGARTTAWSHAILDGPDGAPVKGVLFADGRIPSSIGRPARLVGADTCEVLERVGGFDPREIAQLVAASVVHVGADADETAAH